MLKAGDMAPDFNLPDKDGNMVKLSDFRGQKVVLYFYPKDSTPGCTRQACAFRNAMNFYDLLGVKVIGVSKDSQKAHTNFAEKNELNFTLLSDTELETIKAYGVWQEKRCTARSAWALCAQHLLLMKTEPLKRFIQRQSRIPTQKKY